MAAICWLPYEKKESKNSLSFLDAGENCRKSD